MHRSINKSISIGMPVKVVAGAFFAVVFVTAAITFPYSGFLVHENGTASYSFVAGSVAEATGSYYDKETTCTISASPASIEKGESAVISWTTENAESVTIDEGIGTVAKNGNISVTPSETTSYLLEAKGKYATAKCYITITVKEDETPKDPVCTLTSDDTLITEGESITLTWTTEHAISVELDGEAVSANDSTTIWIEEPIERTFTLLASGEDGEATCTQTVHTIPKPMCELAADPTDLLLGESTTLTWTSEDAVEAFYDDDVVPVDVNGSKVETPDSLGTHDFKVTVKNEDGWCEECQAFVIVKDETTGDDLSCDMFTALPNAFATPGGTTTLSWETTSATEVSINNGIGSVAEDGTKDVAVTADTAFVLTATDGVDTITCEAPVTVEPELIVPQCDAFAVSNSPVNAGSQVTLSWETTNATEVSINQGVGTVDLDGSTAVTVNADTTYTLTATDANGLTDSCQTTVRINSGGGGGGGGSSSPRCEFTASLTSIRAGEEVTLSWDNTRTNDLTIEDSRGNIIVDTEEDPSIDEDEDSFIVTPTQTTTYTLTAIRGSSDRTCKVTITVGDDITVSSSRSQSPLVAGISLSNVPYTGFDAGPILTSVFYVLLVMWGLGIAYFLVLRDEDVAEISTGNGAALSTASPYTIPEASGEETETQRSAVGSEVFAATEVPSNLPVAPEVTGSGSYEEEETNVRFSETEEEETVHDEMMLLENRAHEAHVLLSSDAMRLIIGHGPTTEERIAFLETIIEHAKAQYPSEDGWVVINRERIMSLFA